MRVFLLSGLSVLLCYSIILAGPGTSDLTTFEQPDTLGNPFLGKSIGDEFNPIQQTEAGYTFLQDTTGIYYYATLNSSGDLVKTTLRVGVDAAPSYAFELLREDDAADSVLDVFLAAQELLEFENHILDDDVTVGIIMVEWNEGNPDFREEWKGGEGKWEDPVWPYAVATNPYLASHYYNKYFSIGTYTDDEHMCNQGEWDDSNWDVFGSMRDYYREVSYWDGAGAGIDILPGSVNNALSDWSPGDAFAGNVVEVPGFLNTATWDAGLSTYVFDWYQAGIQKYIFNNEGGIITDLLDEALEDATGEGFDWDEYDIIVLMYAGSSVVGGQLHPGKITPPEGLYGAYKIGEEVTISFERNQEDVIETGLTHIGLDCHEFLHAAGKVPDLYNQGELAWPNDIGKYCLMAYGAGLVGQSASCPRHPCAWIKLNLGWITPNIIDEDEAVSIEFIETNPECTIFWRNGDAGAGGDWESGEYFIAEGIDPVGFDAGFDHRGLLIMHFDGYGDVGGFSRAKLDLEGADNHVVTGISNDELYPLTGANANDDFTSVSLPNSDCWDGTPSLILLEDIEVDEENDLILLDATVEVNGPVFIVTKVTVDSVDGQGNLFPEGNNDLSAEPDETVAIGLEVTNVGISAVGAITFTLASLEGGLATIPGANDEYVMALPIAEFATKSIQPVGQNYLSVAVGNGFQPGDFVNLELTANGIPDTEFGFVCDLPMAGDFPITFDGEEGGGPTFYASYFSPPVVADLTTNTDLDIVGLTHRGGSLIGDYSEFFVLDGIDGDVAYSAAYDLATVPLQTTASGDVDGDGVVDMVFLTQDWEIPFNTTLCVKSGDDLNNLSVEEEIDEEGSIALSDMDSDGVLDIILLNSGSLSVFSGADGSELDGEGYNWPYEEASLGTFGSMVVGDFDCDGLNEIFVCSPFLDEINIFDNTGGNPTYTNSTYEYSGFPIAGDLDGNGRLDIIVAYGTKCLSMFEYSTVAEDYVLLDEYTAGGGPIDMRLSMGDVIADNDNLPEILFSETKVSNYDEIPATYALRIMRGDNQMLSIVDGYPIEIPERFSTYSQPIIHDLDDDGAPDIIYVTANGDVKVIDADGDAIIGTESTLIGRGTTQTPAIADIEGDGTVDIVIAGTHHLKKWSIDSPMLPETKEWSTFQGNNKRTGVYAQTVGGTYDLDATWLWHDRIRVTSNLTIQEGTTIVIEPGTLVEVDPDVYLTFNGTIIAEGKEGQEILFYCVDDASTWGGVVLESTASSSKFAYCHFRDATNGLRLNSVTLTDGQNGESPIRLCHFEDCTNNGIFLRYSGTHVGDTEDPGVEEFSCVFDNCTVGVSILENPTQGSPASVERCSFSGGQIGIKFQYTDPKILKCNFEENEYEGIQTFYGTSYRIGGSTADSANTFSGDGSQDGIFLILGGGLHSLIGRNEVGSFNSGIESYVADPVLYWNRFGYSYAEVEIPNNEALDLFNYAQPYLNGTGGYNLFYENDDAEIRISDEYPPHLDGGHNDFMNSSGAPYIYCSIDWQGQTPIDATENYWVNVAASRFKDSEDDNIPVDYSQADQSSNTLDDVDPSEVLFTLASSEHQAGHFALADSLYRQIITQYSESNSAFASLQRIFSICDQTGGDFQQLADYFITCAEQSNVVLFSKRAFNMVAYANVRGGRYDRAMAYYENVVDTCHTYRDSVYAVIDAGLAYYDAFLFLAENNGAEGASVVNASGASYVRTVDGFAGERYTNIDQVPLFGKNKDLRPVSEIDLWVSMRDLLKTLGDGRQLQNPNVPTEFKLSQNFPNPFNATTMILYDLPKASLVKLTVYDMLGREVGKLINEVRPAGFYSVAFDGAKLSSGVYFLRMSAGARMFEKKMVLMK